MNCKSVKALISPYIDNMLRVEETELIDAHLEHCPYCRKEVEELKGLVELMARLEDKELPKDFHSKVLRRIAQGKKGEGETAKPKSSSLWLKCTAAAAAIAAVLISVKMLDLPMRMKGDSNAENDRYNMERPLNELAEAENFDALGEFSGDKKSEVEFTKDAANERNDTGVPENPTDSAIDDNLSREEKVNIDSIQSDRVELIIQDAGITSSTLEMIALNNQIEILDRLNHGITLKISSDEQRRVIYQELSGLGNVKEVGDDFNSDQVTIILIQKK